MRKRQLSVALSTVTVVAVFGLAGCWHREPKVPAARSPSSPVPAASSPVVLPPAATPKSPLPPPEALTAVLNRLTDPRIPGSKKLGLVEGATPDNVVTLDKFTNALRDNGYLPLTLVAKDVAWSEANPSNVRSTVTINTAKGLKFTFPMHFTPNKGGWQLSMRTAEMLMGLGNSPTASSPPQSPAGPPAAVPAPPPHQPN